MPDSATVEAMWLLAAEAKHPVERHVTTAAVFAIPLVIATVIRLSLPSYFEFEAQEDTVRTVAILERGDLPLYGIGHVRFLGAALGPLVYYLKAIPYLVDPDPAGEIVFLWLFHLAGIVFSMLLASALIPSILASRTIWSQGSRGGYPTDGGDSVNAKLMRSAAPLLAAFFTGLSLAFSVHAHSLTSHPHPSHFAAALMPPFLCGLYKFLEGGSNRWLILSGACLGVMTQLYQLTLFAPIMMVILFIFLPRKLMAADIRRFLIPLFICYLPYLVSELATGFRNTLGFFSFAPGPYDRSMVESNWRDNLHVLLNATVEHFHVPSAFDLIFLMLTAVGLATLLLTLRRCRGARFLMIFMLFYCVGPALVLGSSRIQLTLPAMQALLVLGGFMAFRWLARLWRRRAVSKALAAGLTLSTLVASVLFSTTTADILLRAPLFYPMRILMAEPLSHTPSLDRSRQLVRTLHEQFGIGLDKLSKCVHSPFAVTGDYGHHYLMRVVEKAGSAKKTRDDSDRFDTNVGGHLVCPVLVYDELFPYDVHPFGQSDPAARLGKLKQPGRHGAEIVSLGDIKFVPLDPGRIDPTKFNLSVSCDDPWCRQRVGPVRSPPSIRFFGGCGEFRDLDQRISISKEECEELLVAPVHDRWYSGPLVLPSPPVDCPECEETLFIGVEADCRVLLEVDGTLLSTSWTLVNDRQFAFVRLAGPLARAGRHELRIGILGCVPHYFDIASFSGVKRVVPLYHKTGERAWESSK